MFFSRDIKGKVNLYIFKNNNLNIYHHFEYKDIIGVIIFKNKDFILYSYNCEFYKYTKFFKNINDNNII